MHHKIRKVVHHLRSKPEEERRQMLSLSMILVCVVMVILWTWSLGSNIKDPETKIEVKEGLKPFSVLKSNLIDSWNSATKETSETSDENTPNTVELSE